MDYSGSGTTPRIPYGWQGYPGVLKLYGGNEEDAGRHVRSAFSNQQGAGISYQQRVVGATAARGPKTWQEWLETPEGLKLGINKDDVLEGLLVKDVDEENGWVKLYNGTGSYIESDKETYFVYAGNLYCIKRDIASQAYHDLKLVDLDAMRVWPK